ncbi:unnamed protein product [Brassica oleracea var. botrytis]|uniref:(rape) hypothetical protein n=1 Tax=Brassica napus TaxID=3708 RepID=A0A816JLJ2_BRANA|nr:unnamed protein product [Brassica napus]
MLQVSLIIPSFPLIPEGVLLVTSLTFLSSLPSISIVLNSDCMKLFCTQYLIWLYYLV